ncbi:MAG: B12-binding domain-containing radical SAM protein [Deltaproteobacteria bacterium]|nr:B12-binding domain-containing radical SAM protein [bacterium]MCB9476611.1 B12-binding domain-containing radical SAM protein [Deltaproteobacteria bacterium]MCB9480169.1 B12-binding domain-containing radical SAM protein [Deltaproteobacteria bacterium]MCB9487970.1 B12-binding domain-containing radical SAM protein [Deltaproteobacteria bacterium]
MRVCLINPTEERILQANLPKEIEGVRGKNQPIGLMYIAAAARQVPGVDVRIIDAHAADMTMPMLAKAVADYQPDVIGLTCITFNMPDVMDCVAAARQGAPKAKIYLGGMQPYLYPEETIALSQIDGLFLGEAEYSFPAFLKDYEDWDALLSMPGLMIKREDGSIFNTGLAPMVQELDVLPMPAFDLLTPEPYCSVITDDSPTVNMLTSRGCPFQCKFCSHSITGKGYRFHSPERVVEEMIVAKNLGYRSVLFYDEVFTVRRQRVFDLCDQINAAGLGMSWLARGTINTVDDEMMEAMKNAGCETVTFGVESGSERILKRMNRPVKDRPKIKQMFRSAQKMGLKTLAYMMVGNPDETVEDVEESLALLKELDPDHVHVSVFVAYPATEFYEEGVKRGLYGGDIWREYSANPFMPFEVPTWPEAPPTDVLFGLTRKIYRRFYFRPKKIWQHLRSITTWQGVKRRLSYLPALLPSWITSLRVGQPAKAS